MKLLKYKSTWVSIILLSIIFCFHIRPCLEKQGEVIQRIPAPKGNAIAFLTLQNPHTTVSFIHRVYIQQDSGKKFWNVPVFKGLRIENVKIEWVNSNVLKISYKSADIYKFKSNTCLDHLPHAARDKNIKIILEKTL